MGWLLDKLNLAGTTPPNDKVAPDNEGISLEEASDRAFVLAYYSLRDKEAAQEIAAEVTDFLKTKWQSSQPAKSPGNVAQVAPRQKGKDERHKALYEDEKNRALQIDLAAYSRIQPYKDLSLKRHLENKPFLDDKTLILWYIEDLVEYAIDHNALHIAIGVGKLLFNYSFKDVQGIYEELNDEDEILDEEYRRIKKRFMDRYYDHQSQPKSLLGALLHLSEIKARNVERRFVARPDSSDSFEFVEKTLYHLTPLKPDCDPFPKDFYNGAFEELSTEKLESHLKAHAVSNSADAVERERMHALIHPRCLFGILNYMSMDNPKDKLEIPVIEPVSDDSDNDSPPDDFAILYELSQKNRENVKKTLRKNDIRRDNFSYKSVQIEVDNKDRFTLFLQKPTIAPLRLELEEGQSVVTIQGKDEEGEFPLGIHFISWDKKPIKGQPIGYVTRLKGRRRIEFLVNYQTDELNYPISATVDINYHLEPLSSLVRHWKDSLARLTVREVVTVASGVAIGFMAGRTLKRLAYSASILAAVVYLGMLIKPLLWGKQIPPSQSAGSATQMAPYAGKGISDIAGALAASALSERTMESSSDEETEEPNSARKIKVVKYREIKAQARRDKNHPSLFAAVQDGPQASGNERSLEQATRPANDNRYSAVESQTNLANDDLNSSVAAAIAPHSVSGAFNNESSPAVAGARSNIIGTIKDGSGSPLSDAKLKVINTALGSSDDTESSENGVFEFQGLEAGLYNLIAVKDGFQALQVEEVTVNQNETLPIALVLEKPSSNVSLPAYTTKPNVKRHTGVRKHVGGTGEKSPSSNTFTGWRQRTGLRQRVRPFGMSRNSSSASFRSRSRRLSKPAMVVNEGQAMCVRLEDQISSETSHDNDRFRTTVISPVSVNNRIVIPKGSTITGRISKVVRAANSNGILVVAFETLRLSNNVTRSIGAELSNISPARAANEPTQASSLDKRQMAFVGDTFRGTSIRELHPKVAGAGSTRKQNNGQGGDVRPKGAEAVVKQGAEFCLILKRSITLTASEF